MDLFHTVVVEDSIADCNIDAVVDVLFLMNQAATLVVKVEFLPA